MKHFPLSGDGIGQGGKSSLSNTSDDDILEFIIGKLRPRIAVNVRTFLVKIKTHRGESLNERVDDLTDEGKKLAKAGDNYQWTNRTTRLVYSYYDRAAHQWKKDTWSKTIRNTTRRGVTESLSGGQSCSNLDTSFGKESR